MKILVTGGSGFLGGHVISKLIADGHQVSGLARSLESARKIQMLGGTSLTGDISNISTFESVLGSFEVIVHCAAVVEFWGPWKKYQSGIVDSTWQLATAAARGGVRRFIHISSESVLQDKNSLVDIDESYPYPKVPNSYYGKSKKLVEEALLASDLKMEIVILRPTFIWGKNSASLNLIKSKVMQGQFMWVDQGKSEFEAVHVENVAEAVRLAITQGRDRGVYFVTDNEPTTVRNFFENVFKSYGLKVPTKSIPASVAKPLAYSIEALWKLARLSVPPPLSRFDLSFVAMPRRYKIQKAINELNFRPVISRSEGFKQLASGS